jgi:hypothetical protein
MTFAKWSQHNCAKKSLTDVEKKLSSFPNNHPSLVFVALNTSRILDVVKVLT